MKLYRYVKTNVSLRLTEEKRFPPLTSLTALALSRDDDQDDVTSCWFWSEAASGWWGGRSPSPPRLLCTSGRNRNKLSSGQRPCDAAWATDRWDCLFYPGRIRGCMCCPRMHCTPAWGRDFTRCWYCVRRRIRSSPRNSPCAATRAAATRHPSCRASCVLVWVWLPW